MKVIEEPDIPGAGAGACSFAATLSVGAAAAVGDKPLPIVGAPAGERDKAQLVAEGAETLQSEGSVWAFVTFKVTPREALLLKASHRHSASAFNTVLSAEQQDPCGFVTVLPACTNERQSAMFNTKVEQSTDAAGDGTAAWW